jgi:cell division initiation protein
MELTPLDVMQRQFKTKFKGLDPDEVRSFLEAISLDMENKIRSINELKDHIRQQDIQLAEFREKQSAMQDALLNAQRLAQASRIDSQKKAELILQEARNKAEALINEAQNKLLMVHNDIQSIKRQKMAFAAGLKSLLDTHYSLIERQVADVPLAEPQIGPEATA